MLKCCEELLKFINKIAYVYTAMLGTDYWESAKSAFELGTRNPVRFALLSGLGETFTFLGKLFVCSISALLTYLLVNLQLKEVVQYPWVPTIISGVIGFIVGAVFMGIYGIACDSILVVFCIEEELEKNHGMPRNCPETITNLFMEVHEMDREN